ncbi:MAG: hypothetical protein Q8M76_19740, partial [Spirochaetaceae bacterium]|nr:hypothetical protein [Spirochaetaceae bacterium]
EYLSPEQRTFLAVLRLVEEHIPPYEDERSTMGRPAYEMRSFLRVFLARNLFKIPTTDDLRKRLMADPNLRLIPSLAAMT